MWTLETLRNVAAVLGCVSVIVTTIGLLYRQVVGPWVAKPIVREFDEHIDRRASAVIQSPESQEWIQEVVSQEVSVVIVHVEDLSTMVRVLTSEVHRIGVIVDRRKDVP